MGQLQTHTNTRVCSFEIPTGGGGLVPHLGRQGQQTGIYKEHIKENINIYKHSAALTESNQSQIKNSKKITQISEVSATKKPIHPLPPTYISFREFTPH
jgi:hypothetical protein